MVSSEKNDRNGGVWQSGISKSLAEYGVVFIFVVVFIFEVVFIFKVVFHLRWLTYHMVATDVP